jgi:glutathione S-transferase
MTPAIPCGLNFAKKAATLSREAGEDVKVAATETGENIIMLHYTALVTVLAIMFYFYTSIRVPQARRKFGVPAPAISGNPDFERVFRVHMNTLEWMPIFVPLLWLFAYYVSDLGAAVLGLVWIAGRAYYMVSYTAAAEKRGPGFGIQASVCAVLLVGALIGIVSSLAHSG